MKSQKGIGNPLLIAVVAIVIIVLLFGGYKFMTNNKNTGKVIEAMPTQTVTETPSVAQTATPSEAMTASATKTFVITGAPFSFTPNSIKVKKGDTVKVTFVSAQGSHDLVVEGYDLSTKVLATGKSEDISFVADKAGTFVFYCSVGNHRAMGMKGTLIVE